MTAPRFPRLPVLVVALSLGGCAAEPRQAVPAAGGDAPPAPTAPAAGPTATPAATPAAPPTPTGTPAPTPPAGPRGGQGAGDPTATLGEWTTGIVAAERPAAGVATLVEVRSARHDGHDRLVFTFAGEVPGFHLEYVDRPVRRCGSGEVAELPGDGWLEIRLEPAAAHTEAGAPTVGREAAVDLGNVERLVLTCDFEAVVTWVAAVGSPEPYRVTLLDGPPRLVVDLRHHRGAT